MHSTDETSVRNALRRYRWTAFTLVALGFVLSFFHRVAPAAIAGELQQAFQISGAALGTLAATYFYVYAVMQLPTGVLVDTLGPRRIVALGALVAGIGSLVFGMAQTLPAAMAGRTLAGLGVSVMFIAMLKVNAAWFYDRQFATATGVGVLIGNLGAVLSAAPLAYVVIVTSWRNVFTAVGVFSLLLAVATWLWMRDSPRAAGLPSLRELDGLEAHADHTGHWYDGLLQVVRNRAIWPGFWMMFGVASSYVTFVGLWAVPYLTQVHGMSRGTAANHTSVTLLGFALASFVLGYLSDRSGRRRPVLIGSLAIHVVCWAPLAIGVALPLGASYALFAALGASATGFTLSWSCAKEVSPPALSGMATSLVNAGQFVGVGIQQPLVGWILDRGWRGELREGVRLYAPQDYQLALAVLLAFAVAGLVSAFFVRETHGRNIWSEARKA
ncbi:MAG: MFS transporter [Betaproteobacteria bacterium]|nr:MFS transporter [Betaproteobacteria bacterium]